MAEIQGEEIYLAHSGQEIDDCIDEVEAARGESASLPAALAEKASAADLAAEVTARENADAALQTALDGKATVAAIYGIGTSLVSGDDLNDYMTVGRYYAGTSISGSILNKPAASTYGFELTVENNTTSTRVIQTITYNTSNALHIGKIYKRWYTSDGWSAWYVYEGVVVS